MILSMLWSYAGVSMREREAGWCDTNRVKFLRQRGYGYVAPLAVDGVTPNNVGDLHRIRRDTSAQGMALVLWVTPRPVPSSSSANDSEKIRDTLAVVADMVREYGADGVRYQCEAEFEYTTGMVGGDPVARYGAMAELGEAHREFLPGVPGAVYARVGLGMADAWWTKAWQFGFRCFVELYGASEGVDGAGNPHPGWASIAGPCSFQPPLVGGWNYRVKLGKRFLFGRMTDDNRSVVVGDDTYRVGSPAGPRFIEAFGNPKYGAIVGFFPTSWIKPVVPTYAGEIGHKPSGATLAREIQMFQASARKYGDASKGYSVFVGPEMTTDHFATISPVNLPGVALLP